MWLDPTDTSTLTKVGGGAPGNGDTLSAWATKGGTARSFTQWGSNARPTFVTGSINALAGVRFQSALLTTQTTMTSFVGLSGLTIMRVIKIASGISQSTTLTCLDPSTGFSDITHWGLAGYNMNGWRRPRIDTFQGFSGGSPPASGILVTCGVWDFTNATATLYQSGCEGPVFKAAFGSTGVTTGSPYALSIGGFAQQSGNTGIFSGSDGYVGESFMWLSAKSPDSLVPPHHYLRTRWGAGAL